MCNAFWMRVCLLIMWRFGNLSKTVTLIYRESSKDWLYPDGTVIALLDITKIQKQYPGANLDFVTEKGKPVAVRPNLPLRDYIKKYYVRVRKADEVIEKREEILKRGR